jgi:uncharacterized repeat protein (TIGR01451 family)
VARLTVHMFDFGDAPDPTYPTLLASHGAAHILTNQIYLGPAADWDSEGQPDSTATGDDNDGLNDDDGVVFTSDLLVGQAVPIQVTASRLGYLQAWIDFNRNGTWADPGEQVFSNQFLSSGPTDLTITVPTTAQLGSTFARFRFSSQRDLSFTGLAQDGEVEDYLVTVRPAVDLGLTLRDGPDPVSLGSNLVYTLVVTNRGPSPATAVTLADQLPAGLSVLGVSATQGSCTNTGPLVSCALGNVAPRGSAVVQLTVLVGATGWVTNRAQVSAEETEVHPADNAAQAETLLSNLPIISSQPESVFATNGATATFRVEAVGIGPLTYQWLFNEQNLLNQTNSPLVIAGVQAVNLGLYRVRVSNPNGTVLSAPAELMLATAPSVTTRPATSLSSTGATLNGSVVAKGLASSGWFEWGTSTNYGSSTPVQAAGNGGTSVSLQAGLVGLSRGQTYHYRLVATNFLGTTYGEDLTFAWDGTPPVITSLALRPDGQVEVGFSGKASQVYQVHGSTNLETWKVFGNATELGGGAFKFLDSAAPAFSSRFYRVMGP